MADLATTVDNTFITISSGAVRDSDGNSVLDISIENALQASLVIPDTLPPFVSVFNIDMNQGALVLIASEPIDRETVVPSLLTLQDSSVSPTAEYTLASSLLIRSDISELTFRLSDDDLNNLKALEICDTQARCFLTYQDGAFADTFEEPAVNITVGLTPTEFTRDSTSPSLRRFDEFNRAVGRLSLTFSETVLARSFMPTGITLQSLTTDSAIAMLSLTGGTTLLSTNNSLTLTLELSREDMSSIRLDPFLCTSRGNCYITIASNTITDVSGNPVERQSTGTMVASFILDTIPPMLTSFSLDVNNGSLSLTFSEPVSAESLRVSGISLQSNSSVSTTYRLVSSTSNQNGNDNQNGNEIVINLSDTDLNQIKFLDLARNADSTFITIDSNATRDLALRPNRVVPIAASSALGVETYTMDTAVPQVMGFDLDLNDNTLRIVFNEPINVDNIDFSAIQVRNTARTQSVILSGASISSIIVADDVSVTFSLTPEDVVAFKSNLDLATDATLMLGSGAVRDMAGNVIIVPVVVEATSLTPDTTSPRLSSFMLNLQFNTLSLTFDDVIDPSTFDPTGITLQSGMRRTGTEFYTLSPSSTTSSSIGYEVLINLNSDAQNIRENPTFGTMPGNTYITLLASTIDTPDGEDNIPITDGKGMQAARVMSDSEAPELTGFDLDLNTGTLILTFSDIIDIRTLNLTQLVIQSAPMATPGQTYRLNSGTRELAANEVTVRLSLSDLNGLKAVRNLATSRGTTYITATELTVLDLSTNMLIPVEDGNATQVSTFTPDTGRPTLLSFILDRDSGVLSATFSEAVDVLRLMSDQIRLQDRQSINTGVTTSVTLAGSQLVSDEVSDVIQLRLPLPTIGMFTSTFGSSRPFTYLSASIRAITDLSSNPVGEIPATAARMATEVIADQFPPSLEYFDLDLSLSTLTLVWSKPVSSLVQTGITIENAASPTPATGVTLTLNSTSSSPDGAVVVINLATSTALSLKRRSDIATSRDDTYISLLAGVVTDVFLSRPSAEIVVAMSRQVRTFTADILPPRVSSFSLDLDNGELRITFDEEVVNFDPSGLLFQNDPVAPTANFTLQNSSLVSVSSNEVLVQLGSDDIDGIASQPTLATEPTNTFLVLLNGSVSDIYQNTALDPVVSLVQGAILPDTTSPTVLSYSLDLSREILAINFSEVVDTRSVVLGGLTIQSDQTLMPMGSFILTNSSLVVEGQGRILEIHLIGNDASGIKADPNLGSAIANTFITLSEQFVSDYAGNPVLGINQTMALMASSVELDTSNPMLRQFVVDLSSNTIILTFSEAINISTFNPREITLSSLGDGTGIVRSLSGGTFPFENAAIIGLSPTATDITFLKEQSQLGNFASSVSNTFLSLTNDTARDTSNNPIIAIPPNMPYAASAVIPDTRGPVIVAFTLDINNGNFSLHFDEIVNISTFSSLALTLTAANSLGSPNYTLSMELFPTLLNGGTVVMLTLSPNDLNAIKGLEFCNTTQDCFLAHQAGLVTDELGNSAGARSVPRALQASELGIDMNSPQLVGFSAFDLNQGTFSLMFSETMYGASFRPQSFSFRSNPNSLTPSYRLTGGRVLDSSSPVIQIQLSTTDLNNLKVQRFCTNRGDCVPQFDSNFLTDFAGNPVDPFVITAFDIRTLQLILSETPQVPR